MNNEEIRTQIEHLINEYALKLTAVEAQLREKNEDLRLLRKSFTILEEQLVPAEKTIHDLNARCKTYENTIRELEEQISDLSQLSGTSSARLIKLEHKNTSKFYAIILLCVISALALFFAFNNNSNVLNKIESSLSSKLSSSATKQASKPSKQRKKRKASAAMASTDDSGDTDSQTTTVNSHQDTDTVSAKKDANSEQTSASGVN